jgi:hypothetical protein
MWGKLIDLTRFEIVLRERESSPFDQVFPDDIRPWWRPVEMSECGNLRFPKCGATACVITGIHMRSVIFVSRLFHDLAPHLRWRSYVLYTSLHITTYTP